ncbi:hypothetical protein [Kitasatospora cathayae]|uniref:Uncharacterized protein n=1 Tax=Kitasatospora cathayae TaxID=3004092 RepID=A0ABY7QH65_9ACTN|nr:hypothetical protein [Kitasatospora sp. HUAS 3-15]WBP92163.1 hypothetical protein O1G21_41185 [Kitasatospora sp. HUAS 3-15]
MATFQPCVRASWAAVLQQPANRWADRAVPCHPSVGIEMRFTFDHVVLAAMLLGEYPDRWLEDPAVVLSVTWDRSHFDVEAFDDSGLKWGFRCFPVAEATPRHVLLAALTARWAAIEGDQAGVDRFARNVLGVARPELCRDGLVDALLGDWVNRLGTYLTDPELLRILHDYTARERRRWLPLWERKSGGGRIRLTGAAVANGLTLDDVLTDHRSAEDYALYGELDDDRLSAVLRGLDPDEARVAARYAEGTGSWAEAALGAGLREAYGDRVRRKLKRLGNRHTQRALAAAMVTR